MVFRPDNDDEFVGGEITQGFYEIKVDRTDFGGLGIATQRLQIYHIQSTEFWNGESWQTNPIWVDVERTPVYVFRGANYQIEEPVNFDRLGDYLVRASARDHAGNSSPARDNEMLWMKVVPDTFAPTGVTNNRRFYDKIVFPDREVDTPNNTVAPSIRRLVGKAFDKGSGVESVSVQIERRLGNQTTYFFQDGDETGWRTTPSWVNSMLFDRSDGLFWAIENVDTRTSGEYVIRISVTDAVGNRSRAQENPIYFMIVR